MRSHQLQKLQNDDQFRVLRQGSGRGQRRRLVQPSACHTAPQPTELGTSDLFLGVEVLIGRGRVLYGELKLAFG